MKVYSLQYENPDMYISMLIDIFVSEGLCRQYCRIKDLMYKNKKRTPINQVRNGYFGGMYIIEEIEVKDEIDIITK